MRSESGFHGLPEEEQGRLLAYELIRECEEAEAVSMAAFGAAVK